MKRFVLREDMPDRLGQLASKIDPGGLGVALATEPLLGALVSIAKRRSRAAWVAASISAQRRYVGPFLARGLRRSLPPDWRTSGHSPVYPASFLAIREAATPFG